MHRSRQQHWKAIFLLPLFGLSQPLSAMDTLTSMPLTSSAPSNAPVDPLEGLRDIHLPDAVGWWPLAPGWYLLGFLVLLGFLTVGFFLVRYYLNGRARRDALCLLKRYRQEYVEKANSQLSAARVSEVLRRVALVYFPRGKVASLQGEAWLMFLNNTSKGLDFNLVKLELLEMPYQPSDGGDLSFLFSMAQKWIHQRSVPCSN